jgi:hypothetical protein
LEAWCFSSNRTNLPVLAPIKQRGSFDFAGLHQRQCLKKFIECAKPPGIITTPMRIYESSLAAKEVMKIDADVEIGISALLERQLDVSAYRALIQVLIGTLNEGVAHFARA